MDEVTMDVRSPAVTAATQSDRQAGRGKSGFRADVQGLRAVAVLLVMLDHAAIRGFAGGYVGVDVFFVISGFLITGILVRELRRTGSVSIADFYARRARRILPAASLVLLSVVLVSTLVFGYGGFDEVLTGVLWAAFFAANIQLASSGSDYFATEAFQSPVQHFWSLAVEEQFYLVFPLLIALVVGYRRWRSRAQQPDPAEAARRARLLGLLVAVLCLLSLLWSIWGAGNPASAYYSTLTRGWELGAGALLAFGSARVARLPAAVRLVASWLGLIAIGIAAVTFTASTPMPGYHALLPILGAVLVLAGGVNGSRYGAELVLGLRPMRWIGDISYSLYLWHWPLLILPEIYLGRDPRLSERVALMAMAIVLAALSYRLVETPLRHATFLSRSRRAALAMWPAAVALVLAAVLVVELGFSRQAAAEVPYVAPRVDPEPRTVQSDPDPAVNAAGFAAELARANHPLPDGLRPAAGDLDADVSRPAPGCFAERDGLSHKICTVGDTDAKRTIVVYGDSHSTMWLEPLVRLAEERGWRIVTFMKASCLPADLTLWRPDRNRAYRECDTWRKWVHAEIAKIRPDRIIISGLLAHGMADRATGRRLTAQQGGPVFAAGAARTLATLRRFTPNVYVLSSTTPLRRQPRDCLASKRATMRTCAVQVNRTIEQRNTSWRKAAAAAGAHWVDVVPWLCGRRTCPIVIRNVIVYRDTSHVTRTFADSLRPQLARALDF